MLLDLTLPISYVTGSHLFKFKWHMSVQEVLGFHCINDPRNGILLAKPIGEAFDAGFLCFIRGDDGEHRVHLLDARLHNVKLTEMKAYPWLKPPGQEKVVQENKQQDVMKDATKALRENSVTCQSLQPYKACSFSTKGISALSNAAWPSKLVKAGIQLCPKAASAHQRYHK